MGNTINNNKYRSEINAIQFFIQKYHLPVSELKYLQSENVEYAPDVLAVINELNKMNALSPKTLVGILHKVRNANAMSNALFKLNQKKLTDEKYVSAIFNAPEFAGDIAESIILLNDYFKKQNQKLRYENIVLKRLHICKLLSAAIIQFAEFKIEDSYIEILLNHESCIPELTARMIQFKRDDVLSSILVVGYVRSFYDGCNIEFLEAVGKLKKHGLTAYLNPIGNRPYDAEAIANGLIELKEAGLLQQYAIAVGKAGPYALNLAHSLIRLAAAKVPIEPFIKAFEKNSKHAIAITDFLIFSHHANCLDKVTVDFLIEADTKIQFLNKIFLQFQQSKIPFTKYYMPLLKNKHLEAVSDAFFEMRDSLIFTDANIELFMKYIANNCNAIDAFGQFRGRVTQKAFQELVDTYINNHAKPAVYKYKEVFILRAEDQPQSQVVQKHSFTW